MPSQLNTSLLHLSHASLNGVFCQFSLTQSVGVAALNLLSHLIQVRGIIVGSQGVHGLEGLRDLLLHLRLLQLGKQFGALSNFLL